jgi:NADH pyrophosphatase NudC (nudix superfamily)
MNIFCDPCASAVRKLDETMKFCPKCGGDLAPAEIDGQTHLTCSSNSCDYVFWDNPIPVVAALVEQEGAVILVRNKAWPPKMFGLVTGFLEKGETPESGVLREVKEELGLDGRIVDLIGIYSFFEMNQLILAFHVQVEGQIVLGEELAELKMLPPQKLRPWAFGTGHAIKDWLEKRQHKATAD